jgi:hypothetical protein
MHGLDAHAGDAHAMDEAAPTAAMVEHEHDGSTPDQHAHCIDCLVGHVMAACVAIITTIGGIGLARRLLARAGVPAAPAVLAARLRGLLEVARPPDPAWVRLSVMRC